MCAGNGIVHRKLIENRLDSFMFLDGELRKKIQQLRISMKCESCEYLENSGKGGVLTGRPLLTLKISIIGYLHFCTAACVFAITVFALRFEKRTLYTFRITL